MNRLRDDRQKHVIIEVIEKLESYPMSLREMDVVTIRGLEKTF